MRAEAMDLIQAQRELSDKDLAIFNAELQRQSRSALLAYVLWFFVGGPQRSPALFDEPGLAECLITPPPFPQRWA